MVIRGLINGRKNFSFYIELIYYIFDVGAEFKFCAFFVFFVFKI